MTPAELDAIEARAKAATPGPWDALALVAEVRRLQDIIVRAGNATSDTELVEILDEASCPTTSTNS